MKQYGPLPPAKSTTVAWRRPFRQHAGPVRDLLQVRQDRLWASWSSLIVSYISLYSIRGCPNLCKIRSGMNHPERCVLKDRRLYNPLENRIGYLGNKTYGSPCRLSGKQLTHSKCSSEEPFLLSWFLDQTVELYSADNLYDAADSLTPLPEPGVCVLLSNPPPPPARLIDLLKVDLKFILEEIHQGLLHFK